MAEYIEITTVSQTGRTFLNVDTNEKAECTCHWLPPCRGDFGEQEHTEAHVKDCPVHGWA
jgi:hypothetical protein